MKIGIIGAGRVGCSIGKYLRTKDIELAGYYDVDSVAAKEAAEFTRTESFRFAKATGGSITDYIYHHTGFIYYTGLGTIKRTVSTGIRLYVIAVAHYHPIHFPEGRA